MFPNLPLWSRGIPMHGCQSCSLNIKYMFSKTCFIPFTWLSFWVFLNKGRSRLRDYWAGMNPRRQVSFLGRTALFGGCRSPRVAVLRHRIRMLKDNMYSLVELRGCGKIICPDPRSSSQGSFIVASSFWHGNWTSRGLLENPSTFKKKGW